MTMEFHFERTVAMTVQPVEIVDMDQLEYNRYPIFINRHSVAVIHVWKRFDNLVDIFLPDLGLEFPRDEQTAAAQFAEDEDTIADCVTRFLM